MFKVKISIVDSFRISKEIHAIAIEISPNVSLPNRGIRWYTPDGFMVECTFAWEDKFRQGLVRFETKSTLFWIQTFGVYLD